jgi:predicted ABC-type ATPase
MRRSPQVLVIPLIVGGLFPLRPELATLTAGRLFLRELDRLAKARLNFAFESTLSGLVHLGRLKRWKAAGYRIEIVYLRLHSPRLALRRIAARVKTGRSQCSTRRCAASF